VQFCNMLLGVQIKSLHQTTHGRVNWGPLLAQAFGLLSASLHLAADASVQHGGVGRCSRRCRYSAPPFKKHQP